MDEFETRQKVCATVTLEDNFTTKEYSGRIRQVVFVFSFSLRFQFEELFSSHGHTVHITNSNFSPRIAQGDLWYHFDHETHFS